MSTPVIAFCTCPDTATAEQLAQVLVSEQLAACVNQIPGIRSTYRWQGAVQTDQEVLLLIKTTQEQIQTLATRLKDLHPYDLPELIATSICAGSETYLDWIRCNVAS